MTTATEETEHSALPPWSDAQRDGQTEALRLSFLALADLLHDRGAIDMDLLAQVMVDDSWTLTGRRPAQMALDDLVAALRRRRSAEGEPGQRVEKTHAAP